MKLQEFFAKRPVFTTAEFAAASNTEKPRTAKTRESLLAYYLHTGRITRVRRGLYLVVPPGANPETCPVDPYLLAGKMADDAVLAYHTALEFHGKAYSIHEQFLYFTERASRPVTFRSHEFRGVPHPKALRDRRQQWFGTQVAERAGVPIRVTSLERTLVDLFDRPDLGGGWEEVWRSLEQVEFFNLDQVVEYTLLLGNATTVAKVGLYLEQRREELMVPDTHLRRLREHRPRRPHYLVRAPRVPGRLVTSWNLIVPTGVLERAWQEVL